MVRRIVIVGGGAAGTLAAIHLSRSAKAETHITIAEPRERLGEGVAYGTTDDAHLLNVPASGMSAYGDAPNHFVDWAGTTSDAFLPRRNYAEYLRSELSAVSSGNPVARVHHLRAVVERIAIAPFRVSASDGTVLAADSVVVALGNAEPTEPAWLRHLTTTPVITDPWSEGVLDSVATGTRVLCIGTGLTFVDVALSLVRRGAHVTGVSRHGLLPAVHAPVGELPVPPTTFASPVDASRWIRSQPDWRAAFAALRPATPRVWRAFSARQQAQFLRHARRYWDVHRHRMSATVASSLDDHRRAGLIVVERGDARARAESGSFDVVVLCTGPDDSALLARPPLASLVTEGIIAAGPHGMGVATDADTGCIVDQRGRHVGGLYAIGPLRRGTLWESTAIPEIRSETQRLAVHLLT
jgi:uncharacterized NAD(P)/FAD-binding protein YdhS